VGYWDFSFVHASGNYIRSSHRSASCQEQNQDLVVRNANIADLRGFMGPAVMRGPKCRVGTDWESGDAGGGLGLGNFIMSNGALEAMQFDGALNDVSLAFVHARRACTKAPARNLCPLPGCCMFKLRVCIAEEHVRRAYSYHQTYRHCRCYHAQEYLSKYGSLLTHRVLLSGRLRLQHRYFLSSFLHDIKAMFMCLRHMCCLRQDMRMPC
jgi:hypothetical protein